MAYDYDAQIKHLTGHPDQIDKAWISGEGLFAWLCNTRYMDHDGGCPTMIKAGSGKVYIDGKPDHQLTAAVVDDKRLPNYSHEIKPQHLQAFKEWQQLMDDMGRP